MKIKKITIHGFKSFVDRVSLNFPMAVSGIIGPNGCGKSNIFSNEEGQAPARFANFTEIEICRRLYRSGESEYYINKVQSRLRDIVDLFTDTGIGTRAYSIIEQGQVGWLINAKPEERRVIFEEAAGINKFKHKKDAALRRLEATRENLTRVNDIISEVRRQLNSLNRQAKKAERFKALREEFKSVELLLSSIEFSRMKAGREAAAKRLEAVGDEDLALSTAAAGKRARLEGVKGDYLDVENEYRAVREKIAVLEKAIQTEERAFEVAGMRVDELGREQDRLGREIADLEGGNRAALSEIEALNASLSELAASIDSESRGLEQSAGELERATSTLRAKEDEHRAERTETFKLTSRITEIRHAIQALLRDEEEQRFKELRLNAGLKETVKALESKQGPIGRLKADIAESIRNKARIETELEGTRLALDGLEGERASKEAALKGIKDGYALASARLSTLEDMERNFESIKGGAKAIMLKEGRHGIHGLLADLIETNPGFEKAVESVLGDRLQYVVVESHKEGVEAVEYLKAKRLGKGSFVPVKDARPAPNPVPVQSTAFNYGGAKELIGEVRIKEGYSSIVNCLLGDSIVVDTLTDALELWRSGAQYRTIVTIDGEIIDPQGIITGGASPSSDEGILQKRGEIKRLKSEAAALEGGIREAEGALERTLGEIQASKAVLEGCRQSLHDADIRKVNLEGALKREEDETSRLVKLRSETEGGILAAGQRLSDTASRKAALSSEREELEKGLAEREARAALLSNEIAALSAEKERLSGIVTEIRVALAQAKERHESIKRQIAGKEHAMEETLRRLSAKREGIEAAGVEIARRGSEIEVLRVKIEELLSRTDGVRKEEARLLDTVSSLSGEIKGIEDAIRELESRRTELQELKGELTIDLKEMELNINNLSERIRERYGSDVREFTPAEGEAAPDVSALEARRDGLREKISSLGEVSLSALEEYNDLERRHQFLLDQQTDLSKSVEALHTAISRINRTTREKFRATFDEINERFKETFPRFFSGGRAELRLSEDSDILDAGVEIVAQPPGKRLQNITLLSGGEKALAATSLIFAIFLIKPSPFCLLDEVDAPLDDANIDRFNEFVRDMSRISQFLLITHNKKTMEMADALYGITMEEPGVSKVITLRF
ncbi:MAG: chromosome segregation protein SMC [Deltaproteobacteria bacterium]|nr:chromosome segregation protein SMC [Deltaproteobacteria bacterium]